ncbi:sugar kinase [Streptomyces sp. NPDC017991]|uniref:sugar kinase n=1 Tax=Streptomyces sp. NPDC017991 TaxID=3365026 RepID=UPI0037AD1798
MVTFLPSRPGRLADVPSFERAIGGAESNVACVLAAAGHSTRWVSRVGADGFGDHLLETIASYGVDTSAVQRDPTRPTGIYFRTAGDRATDAHEVAYYRTGSAASAMSPTTVDLKALYAADILHLSGITAALSPTCLSLLTTLTTPQPPHQPHPTSPRTPTPTPTPTPTRPPTPARPLISFDVNYREGLWPDASTAGATLLTLARGADLVFVGEDEAEEAWGITGGPTAIRAALPEPQVLVIKNGSRGATVFESSPHPHPHPRTDARGRTGGCSPAGAGASTALPSKAPCSAPDRGRTPPGTPPPHPAREGDTVTAAPALNVDVVAPVGAGDAFAAGFLSATLRGLPPKHRLRHGHLMAAAALTVPGDLGTPPSRAYADRLAALDDTAWGRLRLGPGWTNTADRAQEEVPTP